MRLSLGILKNDISVYEEFVGKSLSSLTDNTGFELLLEEQAFKPAQAYNLMIEKASSKYILFIHADVTFLPDITTKIAKSITAKPDFGAMGLAGKLHGVRLGTGSVRSNSKTQIKLETLNSCCILINKEHNIKFDDATFDDLHMYVEDYCLQISSKGYEVYTLLLDDGVDMTHHSYTRKILGHHWGKYKEYRNKLDLKWKKVV